VHHAAAGRDAASPAAERGDAIQAISDDRIASSTGMSSGSVQLRGTNTV
jgi:hypothetical protein